MATKNPNETEAEIPCSAASDPCPVLGLVAMLDHESNLPRDLESLPDLLFETENLLHDYAQLDTNPASQARKQEIQYALQPCTSNSKP